MNYKKFNKITLLSILTTFLTILVFNFIIDPYHVFNLFSIKGVNKIKNYSIDDSMSKFHAARVSDATVLLIGTSRTVHINPKYLQKYFPNNTIYNLAMQGSSVSLQKNTIEYFIKYKKIKAIVYGVDFFSFNPYNNEQKIKNDRYNDNYINDYLDSLLSIRTLRYSIKTLRDNIKSKEQKIDYNNGWGTYYDKYEEIEKKGNKYIEDNIKRQLKILSLKPQNFNYEPFKEPTSINDSLSNLKDIVNLCKNNDIELHMFISPIHSEIVDLIYSRKYDKSYNHWKKELAKYQNIYDFSGYNSITTDVSNYIDGNHYQTKLAPLMFAKIFDDKSTNVPDDFGIILDINTIDNLLENQNARANAAK